MKNILINVIKFAISASLIYYLFRQATSGDEFARLLHSPKNWGWLALAFTSCVTAFVISFFRWQLLVRALGLSFSLIDAIRLGFIGLFFCVFTIGVVGGDTLRAIYVCRQSPGKKGEVIASVIFDRVIGLLTMVSIAAFAFGRLNLATLLTDPTNATALRLAGRLTMGLALTGFIGLAVLLAIPELRRVPILSRLLDQISSIPKLGALVQKLIDVVGVYRNRAGVIVWSFLLSIGVNVCYAFTIYAIAVGLGAVRPALSQHFLIEPIAMVANSLPLPGGIGGMETAVAFMYRLFADSSGVMVAFTFRFFILVASAIGGIVWLFNRESFDKLQP